MTTGKGINFVTWILNSVNKCEFYFLISTSWVVFHLCTSEQAADLFPLFFPPFISLKWQIQSGKSAPREKHSSSFPLWPDCAQRVRAQVKHLEYTFTMNTFNFSVFLPSFESMTCCQNISGHMSPFQRRCQWPQDRSPGKGITDKIRFDWRSYKLWLKWGHTAVCGGGGQRSAFTKLCSGSVFLGTAWNI